MIPKKFIRLVLFLSFVLIAASSAVAVRISALPRYGVANLHGNDSSTFFLQTSWGFHASFSLVGKWDAQFGFDHYKLNDDSAGSSFSFSGDKDNHTVTWKADRMSIGVRRWFFDYDNPFNVAIGLTGGVLKWKMYDAKGDTVLQVAGEKNTTRRFSADEFYIGPQFTLASNIGSSFGIGVVADLGRLTGLGTEFDESVDKTLDRWFTDVGIQIRYSFGAPPGKTAWKSNTNWQSGRESRDDVEVIATTDSDEAMKSEDVEPNAIASQPPPTGKKSRERARIISDSDGDGVADKDDRCPATATGIIVDRSGCPLDSDGDGVSDGLDDCPSSDRMAGADIDLFGCETDSDFDGIADYRDACPRNAIGASVDDNGCPLDGDADGVPDGLDDCPMSLPGIDVDRYGCTDVSVLSKPMVLNINYSSGGFEIDPNNKRRLESLARLLLLVPDIKLEVNGYTDDIGTTVANQQLSEKRAARVREFLARQGVAADRIKVFGRGETNFVRTNDTADGRAKNRRIEIVFFK